MMVADTTGQVNGTFSLHLAGVHFKEPRRVWGGAGGGESPIKSLSWGFRDGSADKVLAGQDLLRKQGQRVYV